MNKAVLACTFLLLNGSFAFAQVNPNAPADPYAPTGTPTDNITEPQLRGALPAGVTPTAKTEAPTAGTQGTTSNSISLPLAPTQNGTASPALTPALKGLANITEITATARALSLCPLSLDRNKELKYVEVTLKNEGADIAVILGNEVHADVTAANLQSIPASVIEHSDRPYLPTSKRLAIAAVSLGTLGFYGPMFYEYVTPSQYRHRSLGLAIGRDGSRHEVEAGHFGIRVLMPGDQTSGFFAFACGPTGTVKNIVIPVSYSHSGAPSGTIAVPVVQPQSN